MKEVPVTFHSGDLSLEGVVHIPQGKGPLPGVVVCHSHPTLGGDMSNNIVMALCRALVKREIATLRFNFRGVGQSQGEFSRGVGEIEDATAAVDFLSFYEGIDTTRIGIGGYSFGASMALEVATQSDVVQAVASIASPLPTLNDLSIHELILPKLLIAGDMDHVVPGDQFRFLAQRFVEPKEVHLIYGADHFFLGNEAEIGEKTADFFYRWLLRPPD